MLPLAGFNRFAEKNHLFTKQSKILTAVSGGMDSVLLATLLHAAGYQIAIAHCNFQLRGDEALRDQNFCKALAEKLGVPFFTTEFDTVGYAAANKVSIQMAARDLRYQWFEQIRQQNGYDIIALAHHQNDSIETILLNLTRGTGIAGLHGIKSKNGHLVRPLLFMSRADIADTVKWNKLNFVEDSSNESIKYARNKLRHEVVPKLKELNPNLEQTFQDHLQHFNELEELLEMQLNTLREKLLISHKNETRLVIAEIKKLKPLHLLLAGLLKPYGFNTTTINDLIDSLDKHPGRKFDSAGYSLIVDREDLIILRLTNKSEVDSNIEEIDTDSSFGKYNFKISYTHPPFEIDKNSDKAAIDAGLLSYPLTIRNWQQGDQFYPLGMKVRKKLSDFFIGLKIPLSHKKRIPILVNGNGEIIWIVGYRVDDRYKITAGTKKISIFEVTEF